MTNQLECKTCGTDRPESDVIICASCMEKAICCDCATALQRELNVCSDNCAEHEVSRLKRELQIARRNAAEMARGLRRIMALAPETADASTDCLLRYATAVGSARGMATVALSRADHLTETAA